MGCSAVLTHEQVQAAISARLDSEDSPLADDVLDAHIAACPECAAFQTQAAALSRTLVGESLSSGMAPPADLSDAILAGVEPRWRAANSARTTSLALARVLMVVLGLVFVGWALMLIASTSGMVGWLDEGHLLAPDADPGRADLVVDAAALRLGLAGGLFCVAWRPSTAPALAVALTTMLMFQGGFAMRDIVLGTVSQAKILTLAALALAALSVVWGWAADRGFTLRGQWLSFWRQLSAQPI